MAGFCLHRARAIQCSDKDLTRNVPQAGTLRSENAKKSEEANHRDIHPLRGYPETQRTQSGNGKAVQHLFRLFVAGNGANSQLALANLRSLCGEHLKGRFKIEEIDVVKNFKAAVKHNILVTPALLLIAPVPSVVILGTLSDRPKVMHALRLNGVDS